MKHGSVSSSVPADPRALAIIGDILTTLTARKGFGAWWEDLGAPVRKDIRRGLVDAVSRRLNGEG